MWPLAARAQQPAMPVVGFLHSGSSKAFAHLIAALHQGLAEVGYAEGRNVSTQYRWADGHNDRLPELAADLVHRQVGVIIAMGSPNPPLAAKAATATIPIVFVTGTDPVESGLVTSLNRPNANLTGVHMFGTLLNAKRQELLHELVPTAGPVAMLVNPTRASTQFELAEIRAAADKIGQQVRIFNVSMDREPKQPSEPSSNNASVGLSYMAIRFLPPGAISLFFSRHAMQFRPSSLGVNSLRSAAS